MPYDPPDPIHYQALWDVISFEGFDYATFYRDEQTVLTPRLRLKGYKDIKFYMGERDSFGPLSRVCICKDENDNPCYFVYG